MPHKNLEQVKSEQMLVYKKIMQPYHLPACMDLLLTKFCRWHQFGGKLVNALEYRPFRRMEEWFNLVKFQDKFKVLLLERKSLWHLCRQILPG